MTQTEFCSAVGWTLSKLWRLENGHTPLNEVDRRSAQEVLEVDELTFYGDPGSSAKAG